MNRRADKENATGANELLDYEDKGRITVQWSFFFSGRADFVCAGMRPAFRAALAVLSIVAAAVTILYDEFSLVTQTHKRIPDTFVLRKCIVFEIRSKAGQFSNELYSNNQNFTKFRGKS